MGIIPGLTKLSWIVALLIFTQLTNTSMVFGQESDSESAGYGSGRIKVGVFVSLYSTTGPSWWSSSKIGFDHVGIAKRFNDTGTYELFALLDPGTEFSPEIQQQLARYNFSKTTLNASNVEDLKKVDVMVSGNWQVNIEWAVLDAITEAVKSGVHLVNLEHFGLIRPAYATGHLATSATWASHMNEDIKNNPDEAKKYNERMTELFGLENAQFVWHVPNMKWKLSNKHPILGFVREGETTNTLGINGLVGTMQKDQPFTLFNETMEEEWDGRTVKREEIDPFSIYRCGKGIAINISLVGDFNSLGFADRDDFVKYCADWAVRYGKDPNAKTTRPALKPKENTTDKPTEKTE